MDEEHQNRILHLLDALSTAKIYAGAEMEALCNEKDFNSACTFNLVRDTLQTEITVVSDYLEMNGGRKYNP